MLWKDRLYQSYVSSGQAADLGDALSAQSFFRPRAPYLRQVIRRFVPPDRQLKIVDLGCGTGAGLYFLKLAGYMNLSGVDVSGEQIEQAHRLGLTEATQGQLGSFLAEATPESIDVVLLFDVVEHLSREEIFPMLDGVYRILRMGGRCIVHVPNAEGLYGMRIRYGDLTHELAFTPQSLRQLLATVGFRVVQTFEDKPCVHGVLSGIRRVVWAAGTLPHRMLLAAETGHGRFILSQNMLAVAKK